IRQRSANDPIARTIRTGTRGHHPFNRGRKNMNTRTLRLVALALPLAAAFAIPGDTFASSHREAPLIGNDPAADPTDFYFLRSPTEDPAGADTVTVIANYWPLEEPGGGPNFPRLADEVLYEIKFDNNGDAKEDITYQIYFNTKYL